MSSKLFLNHIHSDALGPLDWQTKRSRPHALHCSQGQLFVQRLIDEGMLAPN